MKYEQGRYLKEFNRLHREMEQIYHGLAVKAGMSDSAFIIFYTIVELKEGCLQKDIADWCSLSRQTINSSIQNLRKQGYISIDSSRGREKEIFLTKAGKQLVEKKIFPIMEMEQSVFEEMSFLDCQKMLELMDGYVRKFKKKAEE